MPRRCYLQAARAIPMCTIAGPWDLFSVSPTQTNRHAVWHRASHCRPSPSFGGMPSRLRVGHFRWNLNRYTDRHARPRTTQLRKTIGKSGAITWPPRRNCPPIPCWHTPGALSTGLITQYVSHGVIGLVKSAPDMALRHRRTRRRDSGLECPR